jgi:hypothetical protein
MNIGEEQTPDKTEHVFNHEKPCRMEYASMRPTDVEDMCDEHKGKK